MILLGAEQQDAIRAHGEVEYPHECCGVLLGRFADGAKLCVETYPISNARDEEAKRNRFLIKPEELIQAERAAAAKQLEVLGFYHSHPDHPAVPSGYDLEHAWPIYSYVIVAVNRGEAEELRAWEMQYDRSRFEEEQVLLDMVA